jgi:signal transduction histidine kinase
MMDTLEAILGFCYAHRSTTEGLTVFMVVVTVVPLAIIRLFCGARAGWVGWLAAGLGTFAPLYVIRMAHHILSPDALATPTGSQFLMELCSMLGNGFFVEAAWRLEYGKSGPWRLRVALWGILCVPLLLVPWGEEHPVLTQCVDAVLALPCLVAITRGLVHNVGPAGSKLGPGALSLFLRGAVRIVAILSVVGYVVAWIVYSMHPVVMDHLTLPRLAREGVNAGAAMDALCYALALLPKAGLCFAGLYVALRDAVGLGISNRHETFWTAEGPEDPILGLVRIADSRVFPSSVALVWSAPQRSADVHVLFDASPRSGSIQIDEEEILSYLPARKDVAPPEDRGSLTEIFGLSRAASAPSLVILPVKFGGDSIGQVMVKSAGERLGMVDRHELEKFMAETLAPALQARREQALLDAFTERFASASLGLSTQDAALKLASILADLFHPASVRLCVDRGFFLFEDEVISDPAAPHGETVKIACPLAAEGGHVFGSVEIAVPVPLQATDAGFFLVHREPISSAVGRLVSARLLDALHWELDGRLDELQEALANADTLDACMAIISEHLAPIGLSAADIRGDSIITLAPPPEEEERTPPPPSITPRTRDVYTVSPGDDRDHGMLRVPLPCTPRQFLRLSVSRGDIDKVHAAGWPWRAFLKRFNHVIGGAFTRITTAHEIQDLQLKYAGLEGVATVAVSTGLIVHQLANLTLSNSSTARVLHEQMCLGALQTDDPDVRALIAKHVTYASELHVLVSEMRAYSAFTGERPVSLERILDRNDRMFRASLAARGIELTMVCDEAVKDARVDVPFHIAALAVANLLENGKAAIDGRGWLRVEVSRRESTIVCHVRDSGRGVAREMRDHIFELGKTTKPGSGGWGLYFTRKSLSQYGATIVLASTSCEGSTFTIHFPEK